MVYNTDLNKQDIQRILNWYNPQTVLSYTVLSGGSENTNYCLKTNTHSFVLTVCEQKSFDDARNLARLLKHLDDHNFATSKIKKTKDGSDVVTWDGKPVMLKGFIEGDIVQDFSETLLLYLGKELAKLHKIKAPTYIPQTLNYGSIKHFDKVQDYAPNSSFNQWIIDIRDYIKIHISLDLPKALIHGDVFYNNIVVDKAQERGVIMDFEEACYYYRVFDIGMMIVGTCSEHNKINVKKLAYLLQGYQNETILLDVEKKALKAFTVYAATSTALWRHHNFNYVNIVPEKKDVYLEMKMLADEVMEMKNSNFY